MQSVEGFPNWRCKHCGFLLGILSPDCKELRIKWRDLYIWVYEAQRVKIICRRCGGENCLENMLQRGRNNDPEPKSCSN